MALGWGLSAGSAAADWLDTLFPAGVPGYGTEAGVTVASRLRPDTRPDGARAGGFLLQPVWEQSIGYDSNVLGGRGAPGSMVVSARPSLLVASDWSRDALGGYVALDDRRDLSLPAQSRSDWTASLGGSLDIGRDRLSVAAAHVADHEDRTQLDALPTDRPVPFQVDDVRASYARTSGRWTIAPAVDASFWHFGDATMSGVPVSQTWRDRTVLQGGATIGYELAPQRSLVFVMRAIDQDYVRAPVGQNRLDSTGIQALAGLDYGQDAVWRYRLLGGIEHRSFAAAAYRARDTAIAEGEIAWMPSGLTTISAALSRSVEDAAQEGVTGFIETMARLTLDHELQRNVLLHASAEVQRADFVPGAARQTLLVAGTGATWLLSRQVRFSATYDWSLQRGTGSGALPLTGDYARSVVLLTLRVGL